MEVWDFGGYATRNNIRCDKDGRTILTNAFQHQDGTYVPLVWHHQRGNLENVLGKCLLENREDGVYAYGKFNDTPMGQQAKALVEHGDLSSLSIFANNLQETNRKVSRGDIREVSLVYAGANPGAYIDNLMIEHSDGSYEEDIESAIITSGLELDLDDLEPIEHADDEDDDDTDTDGPTAKEVYDSMNEDQKKLVYIMVANALAEKNGSSSAEHDDDEFDDGDYEGGNEMKVNLFESQATETPVSLTREDAKKIIEHAKKNGLSLKAAADAYIKDCYDNGTLEGSSLEHGIEDIETLFPEARSINPTPEMIMRQQGWVSKVWNATRKTPFSRVKTVFADITKEEARARGYIKGNKKVEEQFGLLKRVTTPQTVYKLQALDRDDVIDITGFGVVAWLKAEMRLMLMEELSRAVLLGDGRASGEPDKINESNIRPVWKDEDLYTIHKLISKDAYEAAAKDNLTLSDLYIDAVAEAMEDYEGSGSPVCFMSPTTLTKMKMARDKIGRRLYNTDAEVAAALGVSSIVTVPLMKGKVNVRDGRTDPDHTAAESGKHFRVDMILVNFNDYTVGADREGAVTLFDDFDIDYNRYKYLIETRCSGALIKPYSAVAIEVEVDPNALLTVTPDDGGEERYGVHVNELQSGITLHTSTYYGKLFYQSNYDLFSDPKKKDGWFLSLKMDKGEGEGDIYTMMTGADRTDFVKVDDGYCVYRVTDPKTQRIIIERRKDSEILEHKEYTLYGLTLEK